jgi:hypothetical protein
MLITTTARHSPISSAPRGATTVRPLPPGFSSSPVAALTIARNEVPMNNSTASAAGRIAVRIAAIAAGLALALVVGTPWLLIDAPPSPEAVVAARVCCAAAPAAPQPAALPAR